MQTWYKKVIAQNVPVSKGSPFYVPQKQVGPSELDKQIDRENFEKREKTMMSELKTCVFRHFQDLRLNVKNPKIDIKAYYKTDKAIANLDVSISFYDAFEFQDKNRLRDTALRLSLVIPPMQKELQEISGSDGKPNVQLFFNGKKLEEIKSKETLVPQKIPSGAYYVVPNLKRMFEIKTNGFAYDGDTPLVFYSQKPEKKTFPILRIRNPGKYKKWKASSSKERLAFYELRESVSVSDIDVCPTYVGKVESIMAFDESRGEFREELILFRSISEMSNEDLRGLFIIRSDLYKTLFPPDDIKPSWYGFNEKQNKLNNRRSELERKIGSIDSPEMKVLVMRYGLLGEKPASPQQISLFFRIPIKTVEEMISKAMTKLNAKQKKNLKLLIDSQGREDFQK